ncbi:peptidoglycan DD-metalloendopeptidase family protein [Streptomyces sp. ZYX-F-203]
MAARGRHRRYQPNRFNRASLTVTASGAGMAIPLVGTGAAHAADTDAWERVAECESGGEWDVDSGNGHYGGPRFTQSTWEAFGGARYAPRADAASRAEQTAVTERVVDGQWPGAWPVCSGRAGPTRGETGGDARSPASAEEEAAGGGESPARKTRARDSGPDVRPQTTPQSRAGTTRTYTVVAGDTLSGIAGSREVRGGWQRLYAANRAIVGEDPDRILPGQRLRLDTDAAPGASGPSAEGADRSKTPDREDAGSASRTAPRETSGGASAGASLVSPVEAATGTPYHQAGSAWSKGYHTGVDFPVPTGSAVRAVGAGRVVSAGWAGSFGYQVVIRHSDGRYSQYAHLSAISVREGQGVEAGRRIGRSGSTGNSTGPHLHFEVRTGPGFGSDIDPVAYLRAGGVRI